MGKHAAHFRGCLRHCCSDMVGRRASRRMRIAAEGAIAAFHQHAAGSFVRGRPESLS